MLTFQSVPMCRLTERMVRSTLVKAWRLATSPTRTSPLLANATTEGVVREPSAFAMTVGSPPSRTATTEFVVPRSIPTARAMVDVYLSFMYWLFKECDAATQVLPWRRQISKKLSDGDSSHVMYNRSTFRKLPAPVCNLVPTCSRQPLPCPQPS